MKTRECHYGNLKDLRSIVLIVKIRYRHHEEESSFFFFQAAENQSLPTQPDNKTGTRCVIYQMREEQEEILWRQNPQKIIIGLLMSPEWNEMAEGFEN